MIIKLPRIISIWKPREINVSRFRRSLYPLDNFQCVWLKIVKNLYRQEPRHHSGHIELLARVGAGGLKNMLFLTVLLKTSHQICTKQEGHWSSQPRYNRHWKEWLTRRALKVCLKKSLFKQKSRSEMMIVPNLHACEEGYIICRIM